jgi:hypothetical protein
MAVHSFFLSDHSFLFACARVLILRRVFRRIANTVLPPLLASARWVEPIKLDLDGPVSIIASKPRRADAAAPAEIPVSLTVLTREDQDGASV